MTLTRFFTGYLYIPLGGNRKGMLRTYLNILLVFFVSGIWHGAGYTFIVWGLIHGILNVSTRIFHKWKKHIHFPGKENHVLQTIRKITAILITFLAINITWVFFRADSLSQACSILLSLFDFNSPNTFMELASYFQLPEWWYFAKVLNLDVFSFSAYVPMVLYCIVAFFLIWGCKNISETEENFTPGLFNCVLLSALFVWCVVSLSGVSTFLYFNF